jgi:hypothetical protein
MAPGLIIAAAAGGPIGLVAFGGVAAVAAAEFMGAKRDGTPGTSLEDVGRPSEVLLQAIEHADAADDGEDAVTNATVAEALPDHAEDEGGRSIWRDLPPETETTEPDAPEPDRV